MKPKFLFKLFLLMMLAYYSNAASNTRRTVPRWHIKMAQSQGPNACAVEEIQGTNKRFWTECRYWMHRKICGKQTVIRYECCEGYDRSPGEKGCTAVKPLKNILETAEDLGATKFVKFIRDAGLSQRLQREGTFTMFVPINSAFDTLNINQIDQLNQSKDNPWSPALLHHLAEGRIHSKEISSDHLVTTMNRGQQLRVNKYSNGMITVNCAPIVRKDQEATNGLVHLVDSFLEPVQPTTIQETLAKDGRFTQLDRLIKDSGFDNDLKSGGPYTIFAPYDEAFQKYPTSRMERVQADPVSRRALLQAHIVPHSLCLPAVIDEHKLRTLTGERLTITCNETGTYVGNSRLNGEFITTSNSIIHLIGDVLVPNRAKSILELTEDIPETRTFLNFVKTAGAERALEGAQNLTVFAPSDEAFSELPEEEFISLQKDPVAVRDLIMYHIVQGRHHTDSIRDDQRVRCVDAKNSLRLRVYRKVAGNKGYGVESAMIKTPNVEGQNGVVHVIDRVLKPPNEDIVEVLQRDGNFSIMLEALQIAKRTEPELLSVNPQTGRSSVTLFAPSDEAFRKLSKEKFDKVMHDEKYLTQLVKNHIVNNMVPSCAFKSKLHYSIKTQQNVVEVQKKHHRMEVGGAHVLKSDMVTRDGIVHFLDRVILPEEKVPAKHCIQCKVDIKN